MTPSEQLVFDLCTRSFLSLWSYANPRRTDGKELCDVLVVFDENVIIFSIKDIALTAHSDPEVVERRWTKRAIEDSIKQLLGAQRALDRMKDVIRDDGTLGVRLPDSARRKVHLIAVAAGGGRAFPIKSGERDVGYVHVLDEAGLKSLLEELDTARDFLKYLSVKEAFSGGVLCEGEENLLAFYLQSQRRLPAQDILILDGDLWSQVRTKPEFIARKVEDEVSYAWDSTIELLIRDNRLQPEAGPELSKVETVVRTMAAENRLARRALSKPFVDLLRTGQAGARTVCSPSGVAYVFATFPRDWDREYRVAELSARCLVARSPGVTGRPVVVGLATEVYDPEGFSFDIVHLSMPEWSDADEEIAAEARERFGIMSSARRLVVHVEEFPRI